MLIEHKPKDSTVSVETLGQGDLCVYNDNVFMRTSDSSKAIRVSDGTLVTIPVGTQVTRILAKLVWTDL